MSKVKPIILLTGLLALLSGCSKQKASFELEIITTSNLSGQALTPSEENINYTTIANYKAFLQEEQENVLLFDLGDYIHGTAIANFDKGLNVVKVMNAVGYDAATIGNLEFNFGGAQLAILKSEADFPILVGNVRKRGEMESFPQYKSFTINGARIAVVGVTTPDIQWKVAQKNIEGWEVSDPIKVLKEIIPKLRKEHDFIILLSHLGDEGEITPAILAERVNGIDLIIDQHDPTIPAEGTVVGKTTILSGFIDAHGLLHTSIAVEKGNITAIVNRPLDLSAEELNAGYTLRESAQSVQVLLRNINRGFDDFLNTVLSFSSIYLDGTRESVRTSETNLGRLIADGLRADAGTQLAFMNGGGIRSSMNAGDITFGNILSVLPFDGDIVSIEVTGQDLKDALEHGLREYPEPNAGFPHVSGFTYSYNLSAPAGSRIVEIWIDEKPINLEATYTIALLDFLATGGDGYTMFKKPIIQTFSKEADAFTSYIRNGSEEIFTRVTQPRSWSAQ
ncbi:bifunctional metallophosphatase/5'-nucleotidase [Entomospira culicis]|uniref:Bifunctional metallophosphatase/5'-nucleotidase n=1 Tax=Entomospira culicis TaxID=2719989 RepID=A0A968GJ47_9SPIO|nr:bifunctional UDP-sugar hydrolase/5'-nucleotidase [Entomospira culicis]NIZ19685.1 bifunctional metallophosphatase/5'-nucleotidase [Entomospira culicis]NIZ69899.1 bifunctional metallophosphatase/5'-nucleotidase [Entomospira culicis]WDI37004.1 bifunctional UDP-sugar hydrolase/5'-nucleotidase [Entomospira culicis]WDI38633.1 bifunctional UDP-sugar hydrolase/5'-nucleotidase [Entomospira culicis]